MRSKYQQSVITFLGFSAAGANLDIFRYSEAKKALQRRPSSKRAQVKREEKAESSGYRAAPIESVILRSFETMKQ